MQEMRCTWRAIHEWNARSAFSRFQLVYPTPVKQKESSRSLIQLGVIAEQSVRGEPVLDPFMQVDLVQAYCMLVTTIPLRIIVVIEC